MGLGRQLGFVTACGTSQCTHRLMLMQHRTSMVAQALLSVRQDSLSLCDLIINWKLHNFAHLGSQQEAHWAETVKHQQQSMVAATQPV